MTTHIRIEDHPQSAQHKLVKVYTRGRVYASSWAEPWPSEAEALEAWREDKGRRNFRPYDETTGTTIR